MAIPEKVLTLEEFLELPEEEPALELEEGRVIQKPLPKGKHSALQFELADRFNRVARRQKLAWAFPELRANFGGRSYVPDVSLYIWPRIPRDAAGEVVNDFFEPPDIAVGIVSPEQSVNALVRRCLWYVANGVRIAILVDPADRSVLLFRPDHTPQPLAGSDRIDVRDVLPGFRLTVQQIFDSLKVA